MFVFEQRSHKEIADLLGIKESTSASQYLRAKKFLAKKINEYLNKDIEFDELCTSAWLNIDGERCIFEIAKIQKQNSNDNFKDSLIRLIKFMHYIQGRRWIRYKKVKSKEDVDISK